MRVSDEGGPGGMFGSWASRFFDAKQHQVGEREARLEEGWNLFSVRYVRYGGYGYSMEASTDIFATMKQHVPTRLAKTRRARPDFVACEKRLR